MNDTRSMKKRAIIILAVIIGVAAYFTAKSFFFFKKGIDWSQLTEFRVYSNRAFPPGKNMRDFTIEQIQKMKFVTADLQTTKSIMQKSKRIGDGYIWKGRRFALAVFKDGQSRRIHISWYGGFFRDMEDEQNYEFEEGDRAEWDSFIGTYY